MLEILKDTAIRGDAVEAELLLVVKQVAKDIGLPHYERDEMRRSLITPVALVGKHPTCKLC